MGTTLSSSLTEIRELKKEVTGLRMDLKRFIEHANQQHVQTALTDLKQNYAGLFANDQVETAKSELSANMVTDCGMRDKCYGVFLDFLQNTSPLTALKKKEKYFLDLYELGSAHHDHELAGDVA